MRGTIYYIVEIPITIKENPLTCYPMFSEQTAPIGTYDIPMDSDLHGEGPWKIWAQGIDRVFSSITIKVNSLALNATPPKLVDRYTKLSYQSTPYPYL